MRSVSDLITVIEGEMNFIKNNMPEDKEAEYINSFFHDILIYLIEFKNISDIVDKWNSV